MASLLALYAVSLLTAASVGHGRYVQVVQQAADEGTLAKTTTLPLAPGVARPVYTFNDCLILAMLVLPPRDNVFWHALSPRIPASDLNAPPLRTPPASLPQFRQCGDLAVALENPEIRSGYYHRYLHGDWVLAGALLAVLSFQSATMLLLVTVCGLLSALMLLSAYAIWQGPAALRPRDVAFLTLAGFLALFYALPVYGRSLSFAPSDIVLIGFTLLAYRYPLSGLTERGFVTAVALFGTLTAIFEFLIGAIPAGLIVLLGLLALDRAPVAPRRVWLALASYAGAIALALLTKTLVIAALSGWSEIAGSAGLMARHIAQTGWDMTADHAARLEAFGFNVEALKSNRALSAIYGLMKIGYFSSLVGLGSLAVGLVVTAVLPLVLVIWGAWRALRTGDSSKRRRELLLLAAAAVMPVWYVVFTAHTIVHAFFMVRPMVWPAAVLLAGTVAFGVYRSSVANAPRSVCTEDMKLGG